MIFLKCLIAAFVLIHFSSFFFPWKIQVSTLALRCLAWVIKLPLPSLERSVPVMAKQLFQLLKKFARAGAKVGDHFELVLTAFKVRVVPQGEGGGRRGDRANGLRTTGRRPYRSRAHPLTYEVSSTLIFRCSRFQAMTVIIRDFKQYTIAEKHLQVRREYDSPDWTPPRGEGCQEGRGGGEGRD